MSSFATTSTEEGQSFRGLQKPKFKPHGYQKMAIKMMIEQGAAGLLLDPGLGKTSITLAAFTILQEQGIIPKMLVIAPLRVCHSVWPGEVAKWAEFEHLKVTVLHGPKKAKMLDDDADIFVINPEGLQWLLKQVNEGKFDLPPMLAIDESTKFKNTGTMRFRHLKKLLPLFKRRYILTGTPAPNGLMDLFGQIYVLDLGMALGQYITHYRNKYFMLGFDGFTWKLREGMERKIYEAIDWLVMRLDAQDYLDMPELDKLTVPVTLPKDAMEKYKTLEDEMVLNLADGSVEAMNSGVLTGKCRQIASGSCYVEGDQGERRSWEAIHDAKLTAVADLVEQLQGQPCIIAYEFKHELHRLRKLFGEDTPYIGGGVTAKRGREIEAAWNAGEIPILLAHPTSAAHGLNLQEGGRAVIWYTLTWDLELYEQLNRRVWRQGQDADKVFIYHMMAIDTVDQDVMTTLMTKDHTQKSLLNALRRRTMEKNSVE